MTNLLTRIRKARLQSSLESVGNPTGACDWAAYGTGLAGLALTPVSGGASGVAWALGVFSTSTGTGAIAGMC